jgi:hypothetical protein
LSVIVNVPLLNDAIVPAVSSLEGIGAVGPDVDEPEPEPATGTEFAAAPNLTMWA